VQVLLVDVPDVRADDGEDIAGDDVSVVIKPLENLVLLVISKRAVCNLSTQVRTGDDQQHNVRIRLWDALRLVIFLFGDMFFGFF
jgi:hypothetical protein